MALSDLILAIIGVRVLGHGRRMESMFVLLTMSYGLALIFKPHNIITGTPTPLQFHHIVLSIIFLTKASFSCYGLVGNINKWPFQRWARLIGSLIGVGAWVWFLEQFHEAGSTICFGSLCSFWFYIHSIIIACTAAADRPIPGAPGQQGSV